MRSKNKSCSILFHYFFSILRLKLFVFLISSLNIHFRFPTLKVFLKFFGVQVPPSGIAICNTLFTFIITLLL